jgi:tetratricopeptide (TPR) repeat protein
MAFTPRSDVPVEEAAGAALDAEFQHYLKTGGDLLTAGDARAARDALEHAVRLRPRNQRAQNLLGLAYFKQGDYERAEGVYRRLIDDNPADATLRVNLALVHLKTNRTEEAIREFQSALDLNPDHQKAQNYLGLAYAQIGDHARARVAFVKAGNEQMAARMEQLLVGAPQPAQERFEEAEIPFRPGEGAAPAAEPPAAPAPEPATEPAPEPAAEPTASAEPAPGAEFAPEPVPTPPAEPLAAPAAAAPAAFPTPEPEEAPAGLAAFSAERALTPPRGNPFGISRDLVTLEVQKEMLARADGLLAASAKLQLQPEMKRYRGQVTDQPFGDAARRMMRVSGTGRLVIARRGRTFTQIDLQDEAVFLREDCVFAFEESLSFENGRVPSKVSPDLQLVHLRGRGRVLMVTRGPARAVRVAGEARRLPVETLAGWYGQLAPRVLAAAEQGGPGGAPLAVVELTGEGQAIVELLDE